MFERTWRYWRIFATGLCFALFGIGGLLLSAFVFPLLLPVRRTDARIRAARTLIRFAFRAFIGAMRLFGVLRYETVGREKLDRASLLILANHPTLIDTVFLMAFVKDADCIVKTGLWANPFTRTGARGRVYPERPWRAVDQRLYRLSARR